MYQRGAKRKSSRPGVRARRQLEPKPSLPPPPEPPSTTLIESFDAPKSSRHSAEIEFIRVPELPARTLYYIWSCLERMPWMFDDSIRNPYILHGILSAETSRVFLLGATQPMPTGLLYAHSVIPGNTAACAAAVWNRRAAGQWEAIRAAMRAVVFEDETNPLHKLYSHVAAPNTAAHRLVTRLGFKQEGVLRSALCYHGNWTDVVVYGLLAEEL